MSQSSSANTVLTAPELIMPEPILKGGLRSVLSSLDVQLEDELARYRRQRRLQTRAGTAESNSPQIQASSQATPPLTTGGGAIATETAPSEAPGSSLALLPQAAADPAPEDDYFASSAALLESLSAIPEEELGGRQSEQLERDRWLQELLTPAGIGASLLALGAAATASYLLLNPHSLNHLRWAALPPESVQPNGDAAGPVSADSTPRAIAAELPPGAPDLTQREFIQLSLNSLGTIDPNGNPIRTQRLGGFEGLAALAPGGISVDATQLLPHGFGLPGTEGQTGPTSVAPTLVPNVIQPLPQSSLLSGLANGVSGRSTAEQMAAATPLPSVVSVTGSGNGSGNGNGGANGDGAKNAAAAKPAPTIQPMEVKPLPARAPAPQPAPAKAQEEQISYWEPEPKAVAPSPEPAIAPDISRFSDPSYIVVTPYTSDALLADVQAVVPDAYVENFETGAKIQAGVFDDAASAGDLLRRLQAQGVAATVENR